MAEIFGVWVAYNDESAAKVAYEAMAGWLPLRVRNRTAGGVVSVSLFPPRMTRTDEQWIVYLRAHEASRPPYWFAADEMSDIGRRLYDLLATLDGYSAAQVGWEADDRVDIDELRMGWREEVTAGRMQGLVLSEATLAEFPGAVGFVPFVRGYRWIPYAGESEPNYPHPSGASP
jgi:hypothetical protein